MHHAEAGIVTPPRWLRILVACMLLAAAACSDRPPTPEQVAAARTRLTRRWLFIWRDMSIPAEVDRVIARIPDAAAAGYNGIVLAHDVARERAAALTAAAAASRMQLVAIVMGASHDRNYAEGLLSKDAVYVAHGGVATLEPDRPILANARFEDGYGDRFSGWQLQDSPGVTTFVDRKIAHSGRASLRMENISANLSHHSRLMQPIALIPHRQYRISFWLRTSNLSPNDAEVKVLADSGRTPISFQTFRPASTQDWTRYDLVFNSLEHSQASLYLGSWSGRTGAMWWDDLEVEEIGLVNVLRRPGTPVSVRGRDGATYEEGRDFDRIVDPDLNPWIAFHPSLAIRLTAETRIKDGERLRISYYHPIIVFDDRVNSCLSEPAIFEEWRAEVAYANEVLHPAAFLMSHDEIRVANQCALCQAQHQTPGELLASNVRRAAATIRELRPDAEIWVWSDMFDPLGNAVDHYFAANGSFKGSWEGLDKDVGIVNWQGESLPRNATFFANRGLRQILAGYYDHDGNGAGISRWIAQTANVSGISGAMYTTWEDRYDAMTTWATRAWGGAAGRD